MRVAVFVLLALACLYPLLNPPEGQVALVPPAALVAGIALALSIGNPFPQQSRKVSRTLLQAAVVLLGFGLDIRKVLDAGATGVLFAFISISAVFLLGWGLQKALGLRPLTGLLVSTGTAICGGSAIAAMGSVTDAPQEDMSVAVATVFLLNGLALLIFPPLGHLMGMSPEQFGVWAGIAIHDVSSVVGAAAAFDPASLETATAVKLSRVLYLVPITLITVILLRRTDTSKATGSAVQIPWFIFLFLLASLMRTWFEPIQAHAPSIRLTAVAGFSLALFLIGAGITWKTLRSVGVRPMLQGLALWLFMSVAALLAVKQV